MVYLDMGEGGVELDIDVALPGSESERGHGGDGDDGVDAAVSMRLVGGGWLWRRRGAR
jgi:hypothetical protein